MRVCQHAQAHATALRNNRYRAGFETLVVKRATKCAERARGDVSDPDAIGANHAHAAFLDRRVKFALHGHAGFADFLKAPGEYHGERNFCFAAIAQRLRHLRRRHRDQRHIAGAGYRLRVGIGFDALNLVALRIHRIDFSGVACVNHQS